MSLSRQREREKRREKERDKSIAMKKNENGKHDFCVRQSRFTQMRIVKNKNRTHIYKTCIYKTLFSLSK